MSNAKILWTNDHREWYRKVYLQSEHWKSLRASKLAASPECEKCGAVDSLDCHHLSYRAIFDVAISDLQTLCRKCHKAEHETNGMPARSKDALRRSQRDFPEPAKAAIRKQWKPKLERYIGHLYRLVTSGKPVGEREFSRLEELQRLAA